MAEPVEKMTLENILVTELNKKTGRDETQNLPSHEFRVCDSISAIEEDVNIQLGKLNAGIEGFDPDQEFYAYKMDPSKLKTDKWDFTEVLALSMEVESSMRAFRKGLKRLAVIIAQDIKESGEYEPFIKQYMATTQLRKRKRQLKEEFQRKLKAEIAAERRAAGLESKDKAGPEGSDSSGEDASESSDDDSE